MSRASRLACSKLLHGRQSDEQDDEGGYDGEDEDDAGVLSGPVLALDELMELFVPVDERRVGECGHCVCCGLERLLETDWLVYSSLYFSFARAREGETDCGVGGSGEVRDGKSGGSCLH